MAPSPPPIATGFRSCWPHRARPGAPFERPRVSAPSYAGTARAVSLRRSLGVAPKNAAATAQIECRMSCGEPATTTSAVWAPRIVGVNLAVARRLGGCPPCASMSYDLREQETSGGPSTSSLRRITWPAARSRRSPARSDSLHRVAKPMRLWRESTLTADSSGVRGTISSWPRVRIALDESERINAVA